MQLLVFLKKMLYNINVIEQMFIERRQLLGQVCVTFKI